MHYKFVGSIFVISLTLACGTDPGDTASTTGSTSGASTGGPTTGEPTTGGPTTGGSSGGESGSGTQGQTDTGSSETGSGGATSTGEPGTGSSTGEPGTDSSGSTGGGLCAGFEQPGCFEKGCPEGQECKVIDDICVPSTCFCDERTGDIGCTDDCGGGSCVGACPDILCDIECEFGFKTDAMGCQICECNPAPACGCESDNDCVKTSSGCCPCNAGGDEVPASVECIEDVMKCDLPPDQVNCPQVFLCTDVKPACVQGQCVLQ
jgi:hypothetical protein